MSRAGIDALPWFIRVGTPGEASRAGLMGAGWVINIAVAEWIIQKQATRPKAVATLAAVPKYRY